MAAFRNALARDPGSTATITALALTLTLTGEAAEALELAERALRNTPDAEQAWHAAGRAHLKLGHPMEAEAAMRRAVAIRPENVGLRLDHVRTLAAAGRLADARALFDDWLERGISEGMGSFVRFVAKELEDAEARAESR